jgi:hypothetical protein
VSEGTASHSRWAVHYDDGSDLDWDWNFNLPWDFRETSTVRATLYWYSPTAASGNARWSLHATSIGDSENSTSKALTNGTPFTSAVDTGADKLCVSAVEDLPSSSAYKSNEHVVLRVRRTASHGDDTVDDDVRLLYILVDIETW